MTPQERKLAAKTILRKKTARKYEKLPSKLKDLKESYKSLVRELAKR